MKRIVLTLFIMLLATSAMQAQWKMKPKFGKPRENNVTFELQGGVGALLLDKSLGSPTKMGFNAGGTVGYTRLFSRNYGLHTGISFTYLNSGYEAKGTYSTYYDNTYEEPLSTNVDENGDLIYDPNYSGVWYEKYFDSEYDIETKTADAEETYSTMLVEIPLQLAYVNNHWWYNAGLKFSIPVAINANYEYGPSHRYVKYIYYGGTELTEADNIPVYDDPALDQVAAQSGNYGAYSLSDGIKIFVDLAIEGGYRIPYGKDGSLYIGLFVNYALNAASTVVDGQFIDWDLAPAGQHERDQVVFNGAMRSEAIENYKSLIAGLKFYYNIGFGRKIR